MARSSRYSTRMSPGAYMTTARMWFSFVWVAPSEPRRQRLSQVRL
ncbi:hypothetical protein [Microbacterium sp. LWS13-1.2]